MYRLSRLSAINNWKRVWCRFLPQKKKNIINNYIIRKVLCKIAYQNTGINTGMKSKMS